LEALQSSPAAKYIFTTKRFVEKEALKRIGECDNVDVNANDAQWLKKSLRDLNGVIGGIERINALKSTTFDTNNVAHEQVRRSMMQRLN
jgi:hypothetical protein